MSKFKAFKSIKETKHNGRKYTILVYGEVNEVNEMTGFYTVPVVFNGKTNKPIAIDYDKRFITPSYKHYYGRTKVFNMGWSICSECDEFDLETGIKICRRRFNRSPITTQNGRFLTPDMCLAIVNNEADYIDKHIEMFLPKEWHDSVNIDNNSTDANKYSFKFEFKGDNVKKVIDSLSNEFNIKFDDFKKNIMPTKENISFENLTDYMSDLKNKNNDKGVENNEVFENKKTTENNTDEIDIVFDDGDYVYFEIDNTPYVGIFMCEIIDKETDEWLHDNYHFYAPIDENGLIKHDEARFYSSVNHYDILAEAENNLTKLINDYLKGAHSKAWDNDKKRFKIVF